MTTQHRAEPVTASIVVTDENDIIIISDTVTGGEDDEADRENTPGKAQDATLSRGGDMAAEIQDPGQNDSTTSSHPEDNLLDTIDLGASTLSQGMNDPSEVVFDDAATIVPSEWGVAR